MPRPGPRPYECVRRAWHSDRHQPIRGSLTQEIFRFFISLYSLPLSFSLSRMFPGFFLLFADNPWWVQPYLGSQMKSIALQLRKTRNGKRSSPLSSLRQKKLCTPKPILRFISFLFEYGVANAFPC